MQRGLYVKPFVEAAVAGRAARFPRGGEMKRDYSYVKDVAHCIRLGLEVASAGLGSVVPGAEVSIGSGLSAMEKADLETRAALDCRQAEKVLGFRAAHDLRSGIEDYVTDLRAYREDDGPGSQ